MYTLRENAEKMMQVITIEQQTNKLNGYILYRAAITCSHKIDNKYSFKYLDRKKKTKFSRVFSLNVVHVHFTNQFCIKPHIGLLYLIAIFVILPQGSYNLPQITKCTALLSTSYVVILSLYQLVSFQLEGITWLACLLGVICVANAAFDPTICLKNNTFSNCK